MWDPGLATEYFVQDRVLAVECLLAGEAWKPVEAASSSEGTFGIDSVRTASFKADLTCSDLSRFNCLSISLRNQSQRPLLVGLKLFHGRDEDSADISLSGGREILTPGEWQEVKFPLESFGIYGCPPGWQYIRRMELTFSFERWELPPYEMHVSIGPLNGEVRAVPAGPRLTEAGLSMMLGQGDCWSSFYAPTSRPEPDRQTVPEIRRCAPFIAGDSGIFIPAPHTYPRNSADEILRGTIMGQNVGQPIQWDANPLGELEWSHFLHRHHFLRELVIALAWSRDHRYAEALGRIISQWIQSHPVPVGSNGGAGPSWETLSAAWRLREWLWVAGTAWEYPAFAAEARQGMFCSIWEHARSLMDHQGHPNNWLIVESSALALAGLCFPEFKEASLWWRTGVERLGTELRRQFFSDGVHFEVSPLYHAICLHALLDVKQAAEMRGVDLPEEFDAPLEKSADYLVALCRPDFTWPSLNDSSGATGNFVALMKKAGQIFQRSDMKWIGSRGSTGNQPSTRLAAFPDAGIAVMRSHYGKDANFMVFRAGPPGASHSHGDALSLDVTALGLPRLVDPGITSYAPGVMSEYYRSAGAHNAVLVNGRGIDWSRLSFTEKTAPAGDNFHWTSNKDLDAATGICLGPWHEAEAKWTVCRTVIFAKPEYWLVRDVILGIGEHEVTTCWQFFPGLVDVDINTYRATCLDARGPRFELIPAYGLRNLELEIHTGSLGPARGWVSLDGADFPASLLRYSIRRDLPVCLIWMLFPFSGRPASGVEISEEETHDDMISLEITFPQGRKDHITMPILFDLNNPSNHGISLARSGAR